AYLDVSNTPKYAFGYGLSYTNFKLSDLQLSKDTMLQNDSITVTFTLKNTGKYDGEEVVQLYLQDLFASITRPVKELKDFQKVALKAGESKLIRFSINKEKLSFYNQKLNWIAEPGEFKLMIGNSSDNILLSKNFKLLD